MDYGRGSNEIDLGPTPEEQEVNEERAKVMASFPVLDQMLDAMQGWIDNAYIEATKELNVGMSEMELKAIIKSTDRYVEKMKTSKDNLQELKDRYVTR